MWTDAAMTFSNPHNSSAVSRRERTAPNADGNLYHSVKKQKTNRKINITNHQTSPVVSSKRPEDPAVWFVLKLKR